jgi:hypothetical protein
MPTLWLPDLELLVLLAFLPITPTHKLNHGSLCNNDQIGKERNVLDIQFMDDTLKIDDSK